MWKRVMGRQKNDMKCCPLDRILPLHTQTHSSSRYVQSIKPVKNYNTDQGEATQLPLAEELRGIDGFLETERYFSLRVWPLVGYSCSNRWPHIYAHMGSCNWTQLIIEKKGHEVGGDRVVGTGRVYKREQGLDINQISSFCAWNFQRINK